MREIPPIANRIQSRHSALALSSPGPLAQPRRPEGACMTEFLDRSGLSVDSRLADFIEQGALPGTELDVAQFWSDFAGLRSEEHTSELQSLMRISSAVFCLKKKNKRKQQMYQTTQDN